MQTSTHIHFFLFFNNFLFDSIKLKQIIQYINTNTNSSIPLECTILIISQILLNFCLKHTQKNILKLTIPIKRSLYYNNYYNNYNHQMESVIIIKTNKKHTHLPTSIISVYTSLPSPRRALPPKTPTYFIPQFSLPPYLLTLYLP